VEISVTKLDVAKRQLETAIVLYFADGDAVSVHTLCCAAYDVIHALNKKRNNPLAANDLMLKDLDRYLGSKAEKKLFHDKLNAAQNFFKHAYGDPNETHTLNPKYTEGLLLDAVQKYARLAGACPPIMGTYFVWFLTQRPSVLDGVEMPPSIRKELNRTRRSVSKTRRTFFEDCLPTMRPFSV
jgi:hypothetical protein